MPRKIPTQHRHALPTQLVPAASGDNGQNLPIPHAQPTEAQCPNDDRIAAIERHLERQLSSMRQSIEAIDQSAPVVVQDAGLDEHTNQRIDAMVRQIDTLRVQVEQVDSQPTLTPEQVNSLANGFDARVEKMIASAMSSARDEIQRLKIDISSVKRSSATELAEQVELLGNMVTETGKLVIHLNERGGDLEREVADTRNQLSALRDEFLGDMAATLRSMVDTLDHKAA